MATLELLASGIFISLLIFSDSLLFIELQQTVVGEVFAKLSVETEKFPISVTSDKHEKVSSNFQ